MSSGADVDSASYNRNAGIYLGTGSDLGSADDLTSLNSNQDNVNRELLAA